MHKSFVVVVSDTMGNLSWQAEFATLEESVEVSNQIQEEMENERLCFVIEVYNARQKLDM